MEDALPPARQDAVNEVLGLRGVSLDELREQARVEKLAALLGVDLDDSADVGAEEVVAAFNSSLEVAAPLETQEVVAAFNSSLSL